MYIVFDHEGSRRKTCEHEHEHVVFTVFHNPKKTRKSQEKRIPPPLKKAPLPVAFKFVRTLNHVISLFL